MAFREVPIWRGSEPKLTKRDNLSINTPYGKLVAYRSSGTGWLWSGVLYANAQAREEFEGVDWRKARYLKATYHWPEDVFKNWENDLYDAIDAAMS